MPMAQPLKDTQNVQASPVESSMQSSPAKKIQTKPTKLDLFSPNKNQDILDLNKNTRSIANLRISPIKFENKSIKPCSVALERYQFPKKTEQTIIIPKVEKMSNLPKYLPATKSSLPSAQAPNARSVLNVKSEETKNSSTKSTQTSPGLLGATNQSKLPPSSIPTSSASAAMKSIADIGTKATTTQKKNKQINADTASTPNRVLRNRTAYKIIYKE